MDVRKYYDTECYALKNCMHCADCIAFAIKYFKETIEEASKETIEKKRKVALKFVISTSSSENLICAEAISARDLKDYMNRLMDEKDRLPICHYEFR